MGQVFVPKPSGAITVNPLTLSGAAPQLIFSETDAPAGTGLWDWLETAGTLQLRRVDAAANVAMELVPTAANNITMRIQPLGTLVLGGNGPTSIQTDGGSNLTMGAGLAIQMDAHTGITITDDQLVTIASAAGTGVVINAGVGGGNGFVDLNAEESVRLTGRASAGTPPVLTVGATVGGTADRSILLSPGNLAFVCITLARVGNFANDAAAAAGGVPVSGVYRNGSILMIRVA